MRTSEEHPFGVGSLQRTLLGRMWIGAWPSSPLSRKGSHANIAAFSIFFSVHHRHELRFIVCFGDESGVRFSKGQTSLALCVVSLNSVVKDGPWVPMWVSECDQRVTVTCVLEEPDLSNMGPSLHSRASS